MRIAIAACVAACVVSFTTPEQAAAEVVIHVNKSTQHMLVLVDGSERYNWLVSTGARRYGTPNGAYQPYRFERFWRSRKYGYAPMPHSIFFYKGYAVHGTTEVKTLGRIASHGCVRLHPANAKTLFALVQSEGVERTRIVISDDPYSAPPKAEPLVADNGGGVLEDGDVLEIAEADVGSTESVEVESRPSELAKVDSIALQPAEPAVSAPELPKGTPIQTVREAAKAPPRAARVRARVAANAGAGFHW